MHEGHQLKLLKYDTPPRQVTPEDYQLPVNDSLQAGVRLLAPRIYRTLPGNQPPCIFSTTGAL